MHTQPMILPARAAKIPRLQPRIHQSPFRKLPREFKITRSANGMDLTDDLLFLLRDPDYKPRIRRAKRIGVEYAGEWKDEQLRFFDAKGKAVTHRPAD